MGLAITLSRGMLHAITAGLLALASGCAPADDRYVALGDEELQQLARAGDPDASREIEARAARGEVPPDDTAVEPGADPATPPAPIDLDALSPDDLQRAAEGGNPEAGLKLGLALVEGRAGVPADPAAGLRWIEAAAEAGLPDAMLRAGDLYENGPLPDPLKAAGWYRRARDAGAPGAADALARFSAAQAE